MHSTSPSATLGPRRQAPAGPSLHRRRDGLNRLTGSPLRVPARAAGGLCAHRGAARLPPGCRMLRRMPKRRPSTSAVSSRTTCGSSGSADSAGPPSGRARHPGARSGLARRASSSWQAPPPMNSSSPNSHLWNGINVADPDTYSSSARSMRRRADSRSTSRRSAWRPSVVDLGDRVPRARRNRRGCGPAGSRYSVIRAGEARSAWSRPRVDPALECMTAWANLVLGQTQWLAGGDRICSRTRSIPTTTSVMVCSTWMRCSSPKRRIPHRTPDTRAFRRDVVDRARRTHRGRAHPLPQRIGDDRARRFLNELLVTSLDRASRSPSQMQLPWESARIWIST